MADKSIDKRIEKLLDKLETATSPAEVELIEHKIETLKSMK